MQSLQISANNDYGKTGFSGRCEKITSQGREVSCLHNFIFLQTVGIRFIYGLSEQSSL